VKGENMAEEIERKFLLRGPVLERILDEGVISLIWQGYLPAPKKKVVRIRREKTGKIKKFTITSKEPGARFEINEEDEREINELMFSALSKFITGLAITKTRHTIPWNGLKLEVDEYSGLLYGLWILECEFKTIEEAEKFTLPHWASDAIEVTHLPNFKNGNLALTKMTFNRLQEIFVNIQFGRLSK
jgi:adenylate cyclase